jgi:acyl dehydratase
VTQQTGVSLRVGDEMPPLDVTLTREQIKAYADASGDQNPIHQDDTIAKQMGLPGVIAHGMLDFGILARAITGWLGDPGRLRMLKVRFSAMVQPGDTITCRGTVESVDATAGTAALSVWVENQRGERVLNHGEAVVSLS